MFRMFIKNSIYENITLFVWKDLIKIFNAKQKLVANMPLKIMTHMAAFHINNDNLSYLIKCTGCPEILGYNISPMQSNRKSLYSYKRRNAFNGSPTV